MFPEFPFDPTIDDPNGLKPERIQFTDNRPMALAKWLARKTREVMTRTYEIESLADAVILTEVIATYADPQSHHVRTTFDQHTFTVEITPLTSDTAGSAEYELMTELEKAWTSLAVEI